MQIKSYFPNIYCKFIATLGHLFLEQKPSLSLVEQCSSLKGSTVFYLVSVTEWSVISSALVF